MKSSKQPVKKGVKQVKKVKKEEESEDEDEKDAFDMFNPFGGKYKYDLEIVYELVEVLIYLLVILCLDHQRKQKLKRKFQRKNLLRRRKKKNQSNSFLQTSHFHLHQRNPIQRRMY